ncbi:MAG: hypothetical protein HY815_22040, partial [Candidatus Riflebacteria bacterium]|nr:hypothetical protein [Candidatus Riflebacteria bacterium]
ETNAREVRFQILGGSVRFLRTFDREGDRDPREEVREVLDRFGRCDGTLCRRLHRAGFRESHFRSWLEPSVRRSGRRLVVAWGALAGGIGHHLVVAVDEGGALDCRDGRSLVVTPGPGRLIRLEVDTVHGALTPFPASELFDRRVWHRLDAIGRVDPTRALWIAEGLGRLRFLCYREKLLAGSWRYLTYFGRDTLLTVRMLREILSVEAIEAALASVVDRLGPDGEVAHEESLGDQAVLERARSALDGAGQPGPPDAAVLDYKMIDGDFILPIALAEYAADPRVSSDRVRALVGAGARADRLVRNLERVVRLAEAFALSGRSTDLVSLNPGCLVGDWRDSEDGLAGGRYPCSVNAVLVPQALDAIERLEARGLIPEAPGVLSPRLRSALGRRRAGLAAMRERWAGVGELFTIRRDAAQVESQTARYLRSGPLSSEGPLPDRALAGRPSPADGVAFPAVALDASGEAIPVMCSDGVLALFGPPLPDQRLARTLEPLIAPFPAGLWHQAGLLVANPALSGSEDLWRRFARRHYHGTVVWSWPIAMAEMGLARQLQVERPEPLASRVRAARARIRAFLERNAQRGLAELWSFARRGSRWQPAPFGASENDVTESNALQLWSASWLAVALGPLESLSDEGAGRPGRPAR